ncbi:MAG: hypothetical protein ACK52I_19105 [Pseudomonadota bacterium]
MTWPGLKMDLDEPTPHGDRVGGFLHDHGDDDLTPTTRHAAVGRTIGR